MSREPPDENGVDFANRILSVAQLEIFHLNVRVLDLILSNGLPEPNTTRLLFSLDQHDEVNAERPLA